MAKNRIMAQKNAKVKKCDAATRKERKLSILAFNKPNVTMHELDNSVKLSIQQWKQMYQEV